MLSTILAYQFAEGSTNRSYDTFLENSAHSIVARLRRNEKGILIADLPPAAQAVLRHHGVDKFYYQIVDSNGRRLTGDAVLPLPINKDRSVAHFRNATVEGKSVRMCRLWVQLAPDKEPFWVQVAETMNARHRLLHQILLSILVPQVALVALSCAAVWFGVRRGLEALYRLSTQLASRPKLDLSPVDIGKTPAELLPVTAALNDLLLDAKRHMHLQQDFIGNAAHQLRTPMTALKTYIDYMTKVNHNPEQSNVLTQISAVTDRLVHMTNRLLVLARAEGNKIRANETADLASIIDNAAQNVLHEAISKGIELHFDCPPSPVAVRGEAEELTELATNLLENAVRYTNNGGSVWVTVEMKESVRLVVADDGPGIPDYEKERVFERFYRCAAAGKSGCGLGLAIVQEIASKYGATVDVSNSDFGGAQFTVKFG